MVNELRDRTADIDALVLLGIQTNAHSHPKNRRTDNLLPEVALFNPNLELMIRQPKQSQFRLKPKQAELGLLFLIKHISHDSDIENTNQKLHKNSNFTICYTFLLSHATRFLFQT